MMPLKELLKMVLRVRKPDCDINSMIVNLVKESTQQPPLRVDGTEQPRNIKL